MAKRLLALNLAPMKYNANSPATQAHVKLASKLTPLPTPKFANSGCAKRIEPAAREERQKSLAAKREAA